MKHYILGAIAVLLCAPMWSQSEKEKVMATVDKNTIKGHVYFLADDLLEGRDTGTPGNKIAASYLANTLRSYGVQPDPATGSYYQNFNLEKTTPPESVQLALGKNQYERMVVVESGYKVRFSGNVVYAGFGMEEDYKGLDVREKIVVIKGGTAEKRTARDAMQLREQKQEWAMKNGAVSLIEFVQTDTTTWGFIERNFTSPSMGFPVKASTKKQMKGGRTFSHIWVHDEYGSHAKAIKESAPIRGNIRVSGKKVSQIPTQNVVGIVEGTDPTLKNEYVIYSAHYDHVGIGTPDDSGDAIYNGARDNAVGVTTVLSMAENLAKYPTKRSALFILFTAEEKGLLGSKYYVDHPILPLNQMVFCFNSDNGGYNDTSIATVVGLDRTTAEENIKTAIESFGLGAPIDQALSQGFFDRSDNVNFAAEGIPAPTFSLGFTAFDEEILKYYHQPQDEADSLDYDYLEKFFRAYVMAGRNIANDPKTPRWKSGDKYETAAKKLYRN